MNRWSIEVWVFALSLLLSNPAFAQTEDIAAQALGDTKADLVYTTFQQPCRIADTRIGGGMIASGEVRNFEVVGDNLAYQGGSDTGCGVPSGATAVMMNFVAVNPAGQGSLRGSAYPQAITATASLLNYQLLTPKLNVANGLIFPICDPTTAPNCNFDIRLNANGAATHLVADVLGYWRRFPIEELKSIISAYYRGTSTTILPTCTNYTGFNLAVTAPANGKVRLRGNVQLFMVQNAPYQNSLYRVYLATSPTSCSGAPARTESQAETADLIPDVATPVDLPLDAVFSISANETVNYTINGIAAFWFPSSSAQFFYATLVAEFIPD
jgi:hypothetical protein